MLRAVLAQRLTHTLHTHALRTSYLQELQVELPKPSLDNLGNLYAFKGEGEDASSKDDLSASTRDMSEREQLP